MGNNYHQRVSALQAELLAHQAVLFSTPTDVTYLSGFEFLVPEEREAFFCVTPQESFLIRASFCPVPAEHHYTILDRCRPDALAHHIATIAHQLQLRELLLDHSNLHVDEYLAIQHELQSQKCSIKSLDKQLLWSHRQVKDATELKLMHRAGQVAAQAWEQFQALLQPHVTEKALADHLDYLMKQLGADRSAFPTIVAFGDHAASPHHQPTDKQLTPETVVLVDFGAIYQGYRSDMTRTTWFGNQPSELFQHIEVIIHRAYDAALNVIKEQSAPTAADLDTAARTVIHQAGYGEQFIHTTGHGVGLDIHEPPSLHSQNQTVIRPGMVITIEPGIYLNDQLGYRHEDTFAVQDHSVWQLTKK